MFLEFLSHVLSLDIAWIINFIFSNFFWIFIFASLIYFFVGKKKFLLGFFVLIFNLWVLSDFAVIAGWVFLVGGFLALHYIGKLAIITVADESPGLKKYLIPINEFQGYATFILFNIFVVGVLR